MSRINRTKHVQIPAVRAKDMEQQRFFDAVRNQLNMLGGTKLDRVLTVRDVMGGGLKGVTLSGAVIDVDAQPGAGGGNGPVERPTIPTNVQGFAGTDIIFLTWDRPTFNGFAYTEIYRFDVDSLALASRVAMASQPQFSEYLGFAKKVYYWVRHVNVNDVAGPFHATNGLELETQPNYEAIQAALSERIDESYLATALRAKIELLDPANNEGLIVAQQQLANTLAEADQRLTQADAQLQGAVNNVALALGQADARLSEADGLLQNAIGDANNLINVQKGRIDTAFDGLITVGEDIVRVESKADNTVTVLQAIYSLDAQGNLAAIKEFAEVFENEAARIVALEALTKEDGGEVGSRITTIEKAAKEGAEFVQALEAFDGERYSNVTSFFQATKDGATALTTLTAGNGALNSKYAELVELANDSATMLTTLGTYSPQGFSKIIGLEQTNAEAATKIERLVFNSGDGLKARDLSSISSQHWGEVAPPISPSSTRYMNEAGNIVLVGDNWCYSTTLFPVDVSRTYKVRFVVKQLVDDPLGQMRVFAGIRCLDAAFFTDNSGRRYCAASNSLISVAHGRMVFEGEITGEHATSHGAFLPGTVYARLMFIVNYQGGSGTVEVESIEIRDISEADSVQDVAKKYVDNRFTSVLQTDVEGVTRIDRLEALTIDGEGEIGTLITRMDEATKDSATFLTNLKAYNASWSSSISNFFKAAADGASALTKLESGVPGKANSIYTALIEVNNTNATAIQNLTWGLADDSRATGIGASINTVKKASEEGAGFVQSLKAFDGARYSNVSNFFQASKDGATALTTLTSGNGQANSSYNNLVSLANTSATRLMSLGVYANGSFAKINSLEQADATQASRIEQLSFSLGDSMSVKDKAALTISPYGEAVEAVNDPSVNMLNGMIRISGQQWLFAAKAFKVDTSRKYKVRAVVRQLSNPTTGGSIVYCGVATMDGNYNALTSGPGSHRYCAGSRTITAAQGTQVFEGVITGEGDTSHTEFRPGTVYVRPMFIVNYSNGNGTVEVESIEIRDITEVAAVEDTARAYTNSKTGEITAERTIKVQANGMMAGIGLIAGANTKSAIYFSAEEIAILPPGATSTTGAVLPFIYDADTGAILMDTTFIRDLTASKISGGILNLNTGNVSSLTVYNHFSPPDLFLERSHMSAELARQLAWVDPDANETGGAIKKNVSGVVATTTIGSFLSGGLVPTVKITGAGPADNLTVQPSGYIDVRILRNNVAISLGGVSTFRFTVATYLTSDEALPPGQRTYGAYLVGSVNEPAPAVTNNTTTEWKVQVVAQTITGISASQFSLQASIFEAYSSSGGIIASTRWNAISDKPATATRWPTLIEIGALGGSGSQRISKAAHVSGSTDAHLELYSPDSGASGEVSLLMHQASQFYGQLRLRNNGFHFTQGNNNTYRNIYFGKAYGDGSSLTSVVASKSHVVPSYTGTYSLTVHVDGVLHARPELTYSGSTQTLSAGNFAGNGSGLTSVNATTLNGFGLTTAPTGNTVPLRNSAADIEARLFRSTYINQATIGGAMAFRFNDGTDNFIRFCSSQAAIKEWLGYTEPFDFSMGSNTRPNGIYASEFGSFIGEVGNPTFTAAITAQVSTIRSISLSVGSDGYLYGMRMHTTSGVTGFQSKVKYADDAGALGGLALNSTTVNNEANKVVRTQANGYAYFGWINTVSGSRTAATTIDRIYASDDSFLRYYTPAEFSIAMRSYLIDLTGNQVIGGTKTFSDLRYDSQNPGGGTVSVGWLSNWYRYRFGGSSVPQGISISNYDTTTIELNRNGDITASNYYASGWYRTYGNTGWFSETHGGGIHMTDSSWIRTYNGKKFFVSSTMSDAIYTAGGVTALGNMSAATFKSAEIVSGVRNLATSSLSVYPTSNTDGRYTASLALRSSNAENFGWGINAYRNTTAVGRLEFSFHNNSAAGVTVMSLGHNGELTATDFISTSDIRTKKNLKPIIGALQKVKQLTGYTFDRNGREAGYIAQDLEKVLPEGVTEYEGLKRVSNSAVIGLLIQAVKELSAKVDQLGALH